MLKHCLKEHIIEESLTDKPKPRMTKVCESGDSHQCQGHRHIEDTSYHPTSLQPTLQMHSTFPSLFCALHLLRSQNFNSSSVSEPCFCHHYVLDAKVTTSIHLVEPQTPCTDLPAVYPTWSWQVSVLYVYPSSSLCIQSVIF